MGIKLVAFDGSETSRKALKQAAAIMGRDDEILVLMVVPVAAIAEFADVPPDISTAKATSMVNAAVAELKEAGVRALGMVRQGDIADEILKIAADMPVDIIVIGHRGLSKVGRFALGSVADKVARYATRPVLIVR
jgi:nucleotide-binding universal stress UspA family protein